MTDHDRYRLLFGPYITPTFEYGDPAFCEMRGEVTIYGLTDARIPWPLGKQKGQEVRRPSLVLFGSLIDAVRNEDPSSIGFWWGVSHATLTKWRAALTVVGLTVGAKHVCRERASGQLLCNLADADLSSDDPPSSRLLFGPYQPPALKPGDRAFCRVKGCEVIITSWTNASIPWPRCRTEDSYGGSGILVEDELARALRHESAGAIKHWWGASANTVWWWRKALEIKRTDSEGSRRLILVVAQAGADAVKQREFSQKERKVKRRIALKLNLSQYLAAATRPGQWTTEELALLGMAPDTQIAALTGRTWNAVRLKREKLEIPNPHNGRKVKMKRF
jgi:hypothetical protein